MAQAVQADTRVPSVARSRSAWSWAWVGVVPFFLFALLFLILPTVDLAIGSFQDKTDAHWTLDNFIGMFDGVSLQFLPTPSAFEFFGYGIMLPFTFALKLNSIISAFWISIEVSVASAVGGALFGFLLAYAAIAGGLPRWIRSVLLTFSGVASNFAGLPLAFAFLATLGPLGLVTILINDLLGTNIYHNGFTILSFWGLTITYMYFQFPLMVLIMAPAIDGLKREWREASENLGASSVQYWRYIAFPVLFPSLLGTTLLLFANAFGAVATAYQLTGSALNIATIMLYAQIRGDVLHNVNLGYAMALAMILITGVSNGFYIWLRGRSERWLR